MSNPQKPARRCSTQDTPFLYMDTHIMNHVAGYLSGNDKLAMRGTCRSTLYSIPHPPIDTIRHINNKDSPDVYCMFLSIPGSTFTHEEYVV